MVDFYEHVVKPAQGAEAYIAELGGLPEITEAAAGLRIALGQTADEIAGAEFAPRFARKVGDNFWAFNAREHFTPSTLEAIERDGEAGLKRASLEAERIAIENELGSLIHRLVNFRADLNISQQDF